MKAMIFAAGRGERMRPLTDSCPKPLLCVQEVPLIVWHIRNLVDAGITDIVINHAYLGHKIEETLGDGSTWGASITYSREEKALETAGAVAYARAQLGNEPFVAVAADIYCPDFDYQHVRTALQGEDLAYLYVVDNPAHHAKGDFVLIGDKISNGSVGRLNFSGIGVYHPELFAHIESGTKAALGPLLHSAADAGRVSGSHYTGLWVNVGTPEQLAELNAEAVLCTEMQM